MISVIGWERFQHADVAKNKLRAPSWIRVYTDLHSNADYLNLSGHRRAVLHGIWIEHARSRQNLPHDTRTLTRRLDLKVTTSDLIALEQAGFITFPHDNVTPNSSLEEKRVEKEEPQYVAPARGEVVRRLNHDAGLVGGSEGLSLGVVSEPASAEDSRPAGPVEVGGAARPGLEPFREAEGLGGRVARVPLRVEGWSTLADEVAARRAARGP